MINFLKVSSIVVVALLLQVTLLPAYLTDPFQPNLLIIIVVYLGLKGTLPGEWFGVFMLGLIQDCFSGIYLGLAGFSYLFIYLLLKGIADRLYTDSLYLMILTVFLATLGNGVLQLFLLICFSAANGLYASLLPALIPQGLVNALAASLLLSSSLLGFLEESK